MIELQMWYFSNESDFCFGFSNGLENLQSFPLDGFYPFATLNPSLKYYDTLETS
jgi:hypothetical protein